MMKKWKRGNAPGEYESGDLIIRGAGTSWVLLRGDGMVIRTLSSKKSCQEYAESCDEPSNETDEPSDETDEPSDEPRNEPHRGTRSHTHFAAANSLESVLASFRLEVCRLTDMIGLLAASVDRLERKLTR